jgi:hypothetical protein
LFPRSGCRSGWSPAVRHYEKTFNLWQEKGIRVPPCFIIVCQNTAISKLVYDFIPGFHRKNEDGTTTPENGRLPLFRNFDATTGNPLPRPNTLLIDSEQLEAGDALDDNFRVMASDKIERFRREIIERTGDARAADNLKAGAYERAVAEKKTHNFELALPEYLADQADEMLQSSYNLEFLGLRRAVRERELEDRLIARLQQFILESKQPLIGSTRRAVFPSIRFT